MRVRTKMASWLAAACVGLLAVGARAQELYDGPPSPEPEMKQKILDTFDTNGDGQLDRSERQAIRRAMQAFFAPDVRRGRGPRDRGPDARRAPRGDRRLEVDRPPGDRPRREQFRNHRRWDERGRDDRRPEARVAAATRPDGPPRPEWLFNRFDEDRDNELSREEFMRLCRFIHRLHMGPPRRGPDGPRWDRDRPDWREDPPRDELRRRGREDIDRPRRNEVLPPSDEPRPGDEPAVDETL